MLMQTNLDMTRTQKPRVTSLLLCLTDQCFNCYWKSKTDHLLLYLRYYIYLLYLL